MENTGPGGPKGEGASVNVPSVLVLRPGCRGLWGSQKQRDGDAVDSGKAGGGSSVIGDGRAETPPHLFLSPPRPR